LPLYCGEALLHRARLYLFAAAPPLVHGGIAAQLLFGKRKSVAFPQIERQAASTGNMNGVFPLLFCLLFCSQLLSAQLRPADLIVLNANIRTMTARDARAEALAVTKNRIIAIGNNTRIRKLAGPETHVIDAGGKLVLPGFIDAHVHFMGIGNTFSSMELRDVKRGEEIVERIRRYSEIPSRWQMDPR
jgi:hypothetical protein